ncbi:MAG: bifunctional oligoribonuclease/PAP phosphatase NrnA, partial [Pirellulaceae bacterium]|nr:bifunctional oligoribonuclease/PAP phosphatase NrnA [Pirellulaceae bacterium]
MMKPSDACDLKTSTVAVDWARFEAIIGEHHRFVLTTHVRPDCDALGSALAMALVLESRGKEAIIVLGYEVPPNLRWIDRRHRIKRLDADITPAEIDQYDVLIVLDTSAWAQLNHMEAVVRAFAGPKLIVDHHVSSDDLGAEAFRDSTAEATGRLVADAAEHLGVELSEEAATALYAAVATDTGWFRFASTTGDTYRLAARLVDAGASPAGIYAQLYENETLSRLRMVGRAMARAETELDGRLIHTWIERADFEATGALSTDSEDVINLTLAVGGTEGAVIFVEQPGGGFKISFRSRCKMDCSQVAEQFGGGGHKAASGAFVDGPL